MGLPVPMMHRRQFSHINGDDYTANELLYDIHNMSMVIIMPDEGILLISKIR